MGIQLGYTWVIIGIMMGRTLRCQTWFAGHKLSIAYRSDYHRAIKKITINMIKGNLNSNT